MNVGELDFIVPCEIIIPQNLCPGAYATRGAGRFDRMKISTNLDFYKRSNSFSHEVTHELGLDHPTYRGDVSSQERMANDNYPSRFTDRDKKELYGSAVMANQILGKSYKPFSGDHIYKSVVRRRAP